MAQHSTPCHWDAFFFAFNKTNTFKQLYTIQFFLTHNVLYVHLHNISSGGHRTQSLTNLSSTPCHWAIRKLHWNAFFFHEMHCPVQKTDNFAAANLRSFPQSCIAASRADSVHVFPKKTTAQYFQRGHRTSNLKIAILHSNRLNYAAPEMLFWSAIIK